MACGAALRTLGANNAWQGVVQAPLPVALLRQDAAVPNKGETSTFPCTLFWAWGAQMRCMPPCTARVAWRYQLHCCTDCAIAHTRIAWQGSGSLACQLTICLHRHRAAPAGPSAAHASSQCCWVLFLSTELGHVAACCAAYNIMVENRLHFYHTITPTLMFCVGHFQRPHGGPAACIP